MDAKERYYWDVTGHLVVRGVLSEEELDGVNVEFDGLSRGQRGVCFGAGVA